MSCAKAPLPAAIEGHVGEDAIADMWRQHYADTMNSVTSEERRPQVEQALQAMSSTDLAQVQVAAVRVALRRVKKGKARGVDGIAAEHFIHADVGL